MPIEGIPSHYDGEGIQPDLSYDDGTVWNTNSQLSSADVVEGIFVPNVSCTAGEVNVGLTTNIPEESVLSELQPVRDNSTSRPGDAWSERFGIGRAGARPRPGSSSHTAASFRSTRLVDRVDT